VRGKEPFTVERRFACALQPDEDHGFHGSTSLRTFGDLASIIIASQTTGDGEVSQGLAQSRQGAKGKALGE
jgi:hypothetical protein